MKKLLCIILSVLMLLAVFPVTALVSSAAGDGNTYISEIKVVASGSESTALSNLSGYTVLKFNSSSTSYAGDNADLNKKAGGDYIFVGYKTTTDFKAAVKDIRIYKSSADTNPGNMTDSAGYTYVSTGVNLNSGCGSGTDDLWLMYTTTFLSSTTQAVLASSFAGVFSSSEMSNTNFAKLWNSNAYGDCNSGCGSGSGFIYLSCAKATHTHSCTSSVTTQPTCTAAGVRTYSCTKCSYSYTATEAALGHSWNAGTVTTPATCTANGVRTYSCTRSGCTAKTTSVITALGHLMDSGVVTLDPGCTTTGTLTYSCTRSGCTYHTTQSIDSLGHNYVGSLVSAETCGEDGLMRYRCSRCTSSYDVVIPATGEHTYCADGYCTVCGSCEAPAISYGYYQISKPGHLFWFADYVSSGHSSAKATLVSDITLTKEVYRGINQSSAYWKPIDCTGGYFGIFDGNNHTISGLTIVDSNGNAGLFALLDGATVKNLTLSDVSCVCSGNNVGAIAAKATNGTTLSKITVTGSVAGYGVVGGIVGSIADDCTVESCVMNGSVTVQAGGSTVGIAIGGIVGRAQASDHLPYWTIKKCTNNATVTAGVGCGGIAGEIKYGIVSECVNNGYIEGTNAGGIVGVAKETVEYCINNGCVRGTGVGGIAAVLGDADDETLAPEIRYCLNTSDVYDTNDSGVNVAGGICNRIYGGAEVDCCFSLPVGATPEEQTMSAERFASGEAAYTFNLVSHFVMFYQKIGEDAFPTLDFSRGRVYLTTGCVTYSNESGEKAHSWGEPETISDPSCEVDGVALRICTDCGEEETVMIDAIGHIPGSTVTENEFAPSCTEPGYYDSVVYCSVCSAELSRAIVEVPATGHVAGDAVIENDVAPSCTEPGSYESVVYCTVCTEELSRDYVDVPETGHTPGEAFTENQTESTCYAPGGYDTVVCCTVCSEELSREYTELPLAPHTPGEAVPNGFREPTCATAGENKFAVYCIECDKLINTFSVTVPALGHDFDDNGFCTRCPAFEPAEHENRIYDGETYSFFIIDNAGKLFWFRKNAIAGSNAWLDADITVNDRVINPATGKLVSNTSALRAFEGFGEWSVEFRGIFNGDGHTVSGLYIPDTDGRNGFFRYVGYTTIIDGLTLKDTFVENTYGAGALIGQAASYSNVTVKNCVIASNVCVQPITVPVSGSVLSSGGFIGVASCTTRFENCAFYGTVGCQLRTNASMAVHNRTGGFVGWDTYNKLTFEGCISVPNILTVSQASPDKIGAFVGECSSCTMTDSYYASSRYAYAYGTASTPVTGATVTDAQLHSGEAAYLLNGGATEGAWGQTIGSEFLPVLGGAPVYYDGNGYTNTDPDAGDPFDLDRDGAVSISDVTAILNHLAGVTVLSVSADLNGDTKVDISDVTALLNHLAMN